MMLEPFKGISTPKFTSLKGGLVMLSDYSPNCVDLMVLSYMQVHNDIKQSITGMQLYI